MIWAYGRWQGRGRGPDGAVSTTNGGEGCSPYAVVLLCVDTSTLTLADVPSTLGEASGASLDAQSSPSCRATKAASRSLSRCADAVGTRSVHIIGCVRCVSLPLGELGWVGKGLGC